MQNTISRNEIVEQLAHIVKPIALSLARRLPASFEADDLIQWGMFGLMAAADNYEDRRAETFEAYAKQKIRGAILDACKREYKNATCEAIDDHTYQLRAPEPLIDEVIEREQESAKVTRAIGRLTDRQQNVIEMRFNRGLTQAAAGASLGGISQAGVRDLELRALAAMRRRITTPPKLHFAA